MIGVGRVVAVFNHLCKGRMDVLSGIADKTDRGIHEEACPEQA